jgi:hypothetical protein
MPSGSGYNEPMSEGEVCNFPWLESTQLLEETNEISRLTLLLGGISNRDNCEGFPTFKHTIRSCTKTGYLDEAPGTKLKAGRYMIFS